MAYENIKIDYRDTPEKFRETADEVISFLVDHLLELTTIETECIQLMAYVEKGIHIKGKPRDPKGVWALYKQRYGEAISTFCSEGLISRGYAQSMNHYGDSADACESAQKRLRGKYAYLVHSCELAITMKSAKRAVIEISFHDLYHGERQFTLKYTDQWQLTDKRIKLDGKWRRDYI